jgi:hypothetical protein
LDDPLCVVLTEQERHLEREARTVLDLAPIWPRESSRSSFAAVANGTLIACSRACSSGLLIVAAAQVA